MVVISTFLLFCVCVILIKLLDSKVYDLEKTIEALVQEIADELKERKE